MTEKIRSRFAPSPTGMLHIGGARTALFSALFAKATGGDHLIRIEDTDPKRSTQENIDIIKEALAWLDLGPTDGDYLLQTSNAAKHRDIAAQLLATGKAYECFTNPEELEQLRTNQRANGENIRYDGRHRNLTDAEKQAFRDQGHQPVIRLKLPTSGTISWHDAVQGKITIDVTTLDDFIILRADGTPTYNFVVALDDHMMAISHVIRGDDHINNTPKQIAVYQALGYPLPTFAHVPMIHGHNGKMSKRDGATNVLDYRDMGYLPEALIAYLARLGWGGMGDTEIFSFDDAAAKFDLTKLTKSPAVFDLTKLDWLNAQFIKQLDDTALLNSLMPFFDKLDLTVSDDAADYLLSGGLSALKPRAKKLTDLAENAAFFLKEPPFTLDNKAANIMATPGYQDNVAAFAAALEQVADVTDADAISGIVSTLCAETGQKFKDYGMPIRIALAGTTAAPGISDLIAAFGKQESLRRLTG